MLEESGSLVIILVLVEVAAQVELVKLDKVEIQVDLQVRVEMVVLSEPIILEMVIHLEQLTHFIVSVVAVEVQVIL